MCDVVLGFLSIRSIRVEEKLTKPETLEDIMTSIHYTRANRKRKSEKVTDASEIKQYRTGILDSEDPWRRVGLKVAVSRSLVELKIKINNKGETDEKIMVMIQLGHKETGQKDE